MLIKVKTLVGKEIKFNIEPNDTILTVKNKIEENQGVPFNQQRLIFAGKILPDDKKISDTTIQPGNVLHMFLALR
jgi:hypothetical protein